MSETLESFIDQVVSRVEPIETDANLAYWDFTTSGRPEHEKRYVDLLVAARRVYADRTAFQQLSTLVDHHTPVGTEVARQATLLRYLFRGHQMDERTIKDLTEREAAIENSFNTFRAQLDGRKVTDNEIKETLRECEDGDARRGAWEASKQIGGQVADRLLALVELRNRVARQIGFDNYYAMRLTLQELDEAELFGLFDDLDRQVAPVYRAYKAGLDTELCARFGTTAQELRPWHYGDPFFQEAPAADAGLRRFLTSTYAGQDAVALVQRFFHAIGLEVDDVLVRSDLYEREGKQQSAYCVHMDRTGDVRVLCNLRPNYHWVATLLHELGHAAYDRYLNARLPYLLRQPAHTLLTEAVAMMMGRLATDGDWIAVYALSHGAVDPAVVQQLRRQCAAESLIMSRWVPVMSHFERAMYRDPAQNLNRLWWDLVEHFQAVPRPGDRDAPDWAAKIHLSTAPVYYHNYLLGELTASQLRAEIEGTVLAGQGDAGRRFVLEPAVGRYLREKVFHPGAQRHWQDALVYATGERLEPRYFVQDVSAW
jgi:peptidyl-dipeptidase A